MAFLRPLGNSGPAASLHHGHRPPQGSSTAPAALGCSIAVFPAPEQRAPRSHRTGHSPGSWLSPRPHSPRALWGQQSLLPKPRLEGAPMSPPSRTDHTCITSLTQERLQAKSQLLVAFQALGRCGDGAGETQGRAGWPGPLWRVERSGRSRGLAVACVVG